MGSVRATTILKFSERRARDMINKNDSFREYPPRYDRTLNRVDMTLARSVGVSPEQGTTVSA